MKAILLGAGYATRLGELTRNKPKALLEIEDNKPIINYIMENLEKVYEIDQVFLISNSRFYRQFLDWSDRYDWRVPVKVLDDGTTSNETRLGAIGDIMYVLEKERINDDVVILATDNLFSFELKDMYRAFREKRTDMVVGRYFKDRGELANRFAVAKIDSQGQITDLVEKPAVPESNIGIYAIYMYTKDTLKLFKPYKENGYLLDAPGNFLSYLYTQKPVSTYLIKEKALDIGTPESYMEARNNIRNNHGLIQNDEKEF